ncbi:hypothetical protein [Ligilactobacillus equi]|uniref:L-threonine 3-dehydrogenase n=2 Tax=Ligilactobacillus equi TaxID=137357 RepID=V7HXT1_9LACO|nr:hypothetical protein [Ligilactobacillus equi]ETA74100.1 L-threonine 3-dehydrogenase [Ligilactobacillus equi DPC 6820]KRL82048.1 hypothetical protein FC36_GL001273 [Ligilactobacillus equi DSM 15833 = JCM 10991]
MIDSFPGNLMKSIEQKQEECLQMIDILEKVMPVFEITEVHQERRPEQDFFVYQVKNRTTVDCRVVDCVAIPEGGDVIGYLRELYQKVSAEKKFPCYVTYLTKLEYMDNSLSICYFYDGQVDQTKVVTDNFIASVRAN